MVLLSVVLHFALAGLGAAWMKWGASPLLSLTPVTVVDLVGLVPAGPSASAPAPAEEALPKPAEPPRGKKAAPKASAPKKAAPPASPTAMATHDAKPDVHQVRDAVNALRARKAAEASAGKAIEEKRAQQDLNEMLRKMRDRASHQVNLAAMGPVTGYGPVSGRKPDANSEELKYARALDERIRANWTQPVGDAKALVATVVIMIQRDGYVPSAGVEIIRRSGNFYFDESVKRAIMKASPLPSPPEALILGETHFQVSFNFYGSGGVY